jgi:hypothetical protein
MPDRLDLLEKALGEDRRSGWVLSGSLCGWGDRLIPQFDLVVFLETDIGLRLERLRRREISRYGAEAVAPGGSLHKPHLEFLAWAARYDEGPAEMRSRAMHEAWLAELPCPVLRLDGSAEPMQLAKQVIAAIGNE